MSKQTEKTTKKKMKKVKRFFRGLKKLLCCCWCKTRQQDEEAEQYVAADSPRLAQGEELGVCEESGSLADSSSETAPSLQVMCGQSPERESAQSLPEEEEPVSEASQTSEDSGAYIDEALIQSIYALIEEPVKAPEAEAPVVCGKAMPSPSGVEGEAEGQTERRAARRRRRTKKKVQHEKEGNDGEWQLVCGKKKKKKESVTKESPTPAAVTPAQPEPQRVCRKPKEPRRDCQRPQQDRDRVRQSWQESTVKVTVPVPPNRRRHVIGTRGDTIHQLQQQYPAVRVSVPPPQDLASREVMIEGPKTQANAVAQQITLRLQAIEVKMREAEQLRQSRKRVVVKVQVPLDMRRHVVGPGGETLRRLAQEHPDVTVTVPRPSDTQTSTVSIRGPRGEADVVAECIKARVQAAAAQRQRQPNKSKQ